MGGASAGDWCVCDNMCMCVCVLGGFCRCSVGGWVGGCVGGESTGCQDGQPTLPKITIPFQVFPLASPRPHSPELFQVQESLYVCYVLCVCGGREGRRRRGGCYYAPQGHYRLHHGGKRQQVLVGALL